MSTHETEVRFLEIDKDKLAIKLQSLGAIDRGEVLLEETIIYDKDLVWRDEKRFIRLRKSGDTATLTYKEHMPRASDGAEEIEFTVNDADQAADFLEKLGFVAFRHQEKLRHRFILKNVIFDIDTWPELPPYVELEGPTVEALQSAAQTAGFDWGKVVYEDARSVIENIYHIPVGSLRWFTFDKIG
jgi:adenylate cyclase class 2